GNWGWTRKWRPGSSTAMPGVSSSSDGPLRITRTREPRMTEQLPLQRFQHWLERTPERVWLRQPVAGAWHDFTWRQVDDQARRLAAGLQALGCAPGDRVAILAKNCAEWFISDLAIM